MTESFRKGDCVSWASHGGRARGRILRKLTEPTRVKGHEAAASPDAPQYLVETDDGAQAAHKPSALTKE